MPEQMTAAPTFTIQLGAESRTLMYGFRAFKALGLNPFKPGELGRYATELDIDGAAAWVRAGLLWEYSKGQRRFGEEPPAADDLVDLLDFPKFMTTFDRSIEAAGLKPKEGEEAGEPQDPPAA